MLKCPVDQLRDPEFTVSRGVALLGFHRLGELALDEFEAAAPVAAVYEPSADAADRYDELFTQFVRVFKRNRDIFRALNAGS